jgi:methylenetetrahydrofolate--tRNA-(uracil-5-)-methyltransferase
MNVNFALFPPLKNKIRDKKLRNTKLANRALECIKEISESL